jgi:hypothetical protein
VARLFLDGVNNNQKPKIEIITDDPIRAFLMEKKFISFHHHEYGDQIVKMTARLWRIARQKRNHRISFSGKCDVMRAKLTTFSFTRRRDDFCVAGHHALAT